MSTLFALDLDHHELAQQTQVESGLLQHLINGLRAALAWEVRGDDFSRKLSTLRFISGSFQRHLERLMTLEEVDGYMDLVLETKPFLSKSVGCLKQDHEGFRSSTRDVVCRLAIVHPTDPITFAEICDDLAELLNKLETHGRKEVKLFQEAFEQEEGGEG